MMGWRYPDSGSDILLAREPEMLKTLFSAYCDNTVGKGDNTVAKGGPHEAGELNAGFDAKSRL